MPRARPTLAAIVLLASLEPAQAVETPRSTATDSRVRYVDYNETQVYKLNGVFRAATHIIFGVGEEITSVALGDTVSWEVAPADNMLFVKPREAAGWFLKNYQADKQSARAPDSLLFLAESMIALKDTSRACIALAEFGETYPALATGRLKDQYEADRQKVKCN